MKEEKFNNSFNNCTHKCLYAKLSILYKSKIQVIKHTKSGPMISHSAGSRLVI